MGDPGDDGLPSLRTGDRVAVIAPSGPADPARLERGCAVLREFGFEVSVGKHALDHNPSGLTYLAGSDAERAADLQAAWCDPRISAVFCARGGYGAVRVLDHLDWTALGDARPKLLHGSSDITALHAAFGRRLSVPTSFGPMVSFLADRDAEELADLRDGLFGTGMTVEGTHALRGGRARGVLTGGNLTLLTSLLGTPYAPEPAAGRIVFLEDVNEAPYRVDRMLTQLLLAGYFEDVAGIVLGTWTDCGDLEAVFADRLTPIGAPILAGVPVGHGPRQLTIRLGAGAELDADARVLVASTGDGPARRTPPAGPVSEETP
jgi:muramoyltetrapeptide carboxypeptidase